MKKLSLDVGALSDEQLLELMAEHPTLIRRPLLLQEGELVVGFDRATYQDRLGR